MITLNHVMRANAASCLVFGLIFVLIPAGVATFLSAEAPAQNRVLQILGLVLIINGAHLIWASIKTTPSKFLVIYFVIGDFAWVFLSLLLVLLGLWVTTRAGVVVTLVIAVFVAVFGVMQLIKSK